MGAPLSSPRAAARAIAAGQATGTVALPLALHVAARIAERDPEDFLYDPTQLANALRDLIEAIDPDAVPVSDPHALLVGCRAAADLATSEHLKASVEAARRLRASFGDQIALAAILPGPAALAEVTGTAPGDVPLALGKEFLAAGADVLIVQDATETPGVTLTTLANVARFHQALAMSHAVPRYGLPATVPVELSTPVGARGVVVTPATLPRDTDIALLSDWVAAVRG